jgi:RecJ-like exonuclease
MGLRELATKLSKSVHQIHDERLQDRFAGLGLSPMSDLTDRASVRVGGEISRMKLTPRSGGPALEITVTDGTGSVAAMFTGRRSIPGVEHGASIVLEGVAHNERGHLVFMNPAYTLI